MRVGAEAEIRFTAPILQIVNGFETAASEVGDLIARDAHPAKAFCRSLVEIRNRVVIGHVARAIAHAAEQQFTP